MRRFFFQNFKYVLSCLLASMVSDNKLPITPIEDPSYVTSCCFLTFRDSLWFLTVCLLYLGVGLFEFILLGISCIPWTYRFVSFIKFGNLEDFFLQIFLCFFSLPSISVTPLMPMMIHLMVTNRSGRLCSLFFILLFLPQIT